MTCAPAPCGGRISCSCGCCEPPGTVTPVLIWNRPGLTRLDYRVGTYAGFRRAMIEGIATRPELVRWTARNPEDYGIAVLSMWAYVCDILTFYGERAIHEAFLHTALHDRSLRRLAAMLDYLGDPGVAATAHLAYTAEAGKPYEVRPGMRVQSVPGQDEKPQKFEPIESVEVEPALGAVRVFPAPALVTPLAQGSVHATLHPDFHQKEPALAPGDRLVATTSSGVEEKTLDAIEAVDWRTEIRWKPSMQTAGDLLYKWRRKMRLFGHNAPENYVFLTETDTGLQWGTGETDFEVSGSALDLDGAYDVATGVTLLVVDGTSVTEHAVTAVQSAAATRGPLTATVTRLTVTPALPTITDLRTVTVYELAEVIPDGVEVELWGCAYPEELGASPDQDAVYVRTEDAAALDGIEKGRRLILADGTGVVVSVTVKGPPEELFFDGATHWKIPFTPNLEAPLRAATAKMLANVAEATHGDTVSGEVLGSGDASREFQIFALAKGPVTHVPDPIAAQGAASTVDVRVNGVRWREVRDFYGRGPDERIFITRVDEKGKMRVRFGDGRTGARVHSGKNNVVADYRHGLGASGRVAAGALRTALDRPPGLKGVTNPAPAFGGADPELGDRTRENAPNIVRTFGRVVSLRDFEDAAREYAGVAKARAVERWQGERSGVWLFVAGDEGALLGENGLRQLRDWLDARRDPYQELTVEDHTPLPVELELDVEVHPDHDGETVQAAVTDALLAHFDFAARDLGEPVRLSDLYRVAQEVPGVEGVDFDRLMFKDPSNLALPNRRSLQHDGTDWLPVQPRLLLFGEELAVIEDPAVDVVVNLGIEE